MRIEDFKRWQWCVIGLFIGSIVAAVTLWAGPREANDVHINTGGPQILEEQLLARKDPSRRKVAGVQNFKIHPAIEMPLPGGKVGPAEFASYQVLLRQDKNPVKCDPVTYQLMMHLTTHKKSVLGDVSNMTVRDYLAKLKDYTDKINKDHPKAVFTFTYKYNWIETPGGAFAVFPAAGFVLIGLIWPSILGLLVRAGYGHGADDEFDLSKYKSRPAPAGKKKPGLTRADAEELARLEAELEAKLKAGEVGATTASADGPAAAPEKPAIRALEAGPLEQPKAPTKPREQKGYGADQGDYYPTEVHGKPKQ
jgi:hypothetical protein